MTEEMKAMPRLGQKAPQFAAVTTNGEINFPEDFQGKWVILFSHPADFTPVCTTEIATFAAMYDEFKDLNIELVGLSIDSNSSHLAWIKDIEEKIRFDGYEGQKIKYPLIADSKGEIAAMYGMTNPFAGDTKACRTVFFIDPDGIIRAIIYYPLNVGRNFDEIKRVAEALQTADQYGVSTPANWYPGDDVMLPAPGSRKEMDQRIENINEGKVACEDWFFCTKKLPDTPADSLK